MIKKIATFLLIILFLFVIVSVVNAEDIGDEPVKITGYENLSGGEISGTINKFYRTAIVLGGIAAVLAIVVGGIMYAVSGAINKKNKGKDIIVSAISGLVLLLGAYVILNTVNPQLTRLSNPQYATKDGDKIEGVSSFEKGSTNITGASCSNNPDLEKCEEGENPEQNAEGEWSCCVYNAGGVCNLQGLENCDPNGTKIEVGKINSNLEAKCENEDAEIYHYNTGRNCYAETYCRYEDNSHDETDYCANSDGEKIDNYKAVYMNGEYVCLKKGSDSSVEIEVPDCSSIVGGSCEDKWEGWNNETIKVGGAYYQAPYFPKNGDAGEQNTDTGVRCVPYAFKENACSQEWTYGELDGLNTCQ